MSEKLPADFKAKWIAALRSGEFKQGGQALYCKDGNEFCCLGVACKVAGIPLDNIGDEYFIRSDWDEVPEVLYGERPLPLKLADMNDGTNDYLNNRHTFAQIADYIEANL